MKTLRRNIEIEFNGKTHEIIPGPRLIAAIEQRPKGYPLIELATSERITDHAWILYCALKTKIKDLTKNQVIDIVAIDHNKYIPISISICAELLNPEAAREIEKNLEKAKAQVEEQAVEDDGDQGND